MPGGYPWTQGDLLLANDLNAAIANAGALSGGAANVLDFGADPTGVADSTIAIRSAIATGKNVWLPAGTYLITGQLTLATANGSQSLRGDGLNTILLVDTRFDPSVTTGVILLTGAGRNDYRPLVSDLTIRFVQPTDIVTTATAGSAAGTNTITVSSVAGVVVGMSVLNKTTPASTPNPASGTALTPLTVSSIAGNVVTLSGNLAGAGVAIGNTIQFAAVRSMFNTLAAGGTAGVGGTGIQYPWAIYNSTGQTTELRNIMVINAWNGIYIRGSAFRLDTLYVGAFNIGLDVDQSFNFPSINDFRYWPWGFYGTGAVVDALGSVFYDGQAIAANFGEADGVGIHNFMAWSGVVNLTTAWSWGAFTNLMLDGNNSNLNIQTARAAGFVHITNCYSSKGNMSHGTPVVLNAPPGFHALFTDLNMAAAAPSTNGVLVQGGVMQIVNSYITDQIQSNTPMIRVTGGALYLSDSTLDANAGRTDTYISLAGTAVLHMQDCHFVAAAGAGGIGVAGLAATPVILDNVTWNGWAVSLPAGANNWLPVSTTYANDAAAAAAGVGVGELYRNGSVVQVRVT